MSARLYKCKFGENPKSESHTQGHKWIFIHTFHIYDLIRVKVGVRYMNIMLLLFKSFMKICGSY